MNDVPDERIERAVKLFDWMKRNPHLLEDTGGKTAARIEAALRAKHKFSPENYTLTSPRGITPST